MFFEKGYENVYLLSGGIEGFLEQFAELCEGTNVPKPKKAFKDEEEKKAQDKKIQRKTRKS